MSTKSILITGCSSGIGLHAALTLSARGYQVFATARKAQDVTELQAKGLSAYQLDLTEPESISQTLAQVLEITGGRLDYLFNNGAYGQPGALEDLPTAALRAQFETNVFGWHELTKQIIPVMKRQGHGRIIQCSSVLGFVSMAYRGAYNASKYAIEGLTDTLRLELKSANIAVILLEPGPINTEFRANALAAIQAHIDIEASDHKVQYQQQIARLSSEKSNAPFTLEPLDVTQALIHALESKRPKLRYRITMPTKIFALLKRLLPARWLDYLLAKG
ncbi:SDR family oxidoreductase [Colwellia sp. MB02u-18]|uniref:SDR family oxidoreductase n=1 Tax=unclassified Colwellia TaxID=196834 RepID=UPI0015F6D657|nr:MULTISPECIES: SDR family oxidoreductase [unclassified Colwellia]MBA6224071.1 SDR family oxidoreductase [Colwellia sp. MB3u-45]MBA6269037.1 SDR family oxidoreductase [Colwellia sp. MB3u-43]MBA6320877.1 SDR family oxidoreductase [Colwellia sp. MB02u-19]MBA6324157.1 SDR family oxidoreductase [Colwellia sp. MB02u-18]MBA6332706.1 SDR family oxidoreductase [Colwellia sp. MB02u-12]